MITDGDGEMLARFAAETEGLADIEPAAATVLAILAAARRAGLDGGVMTGMAAALAGLGARPYDIYRAGRGSGPAYRTDQELLVGAADAAASFRDTTGRLAAIIAETAAAWERARADSGAAGDLAASLRCLPPGTADPDAAAAVRAAEWDAACRLAQAEEILGPARGALAALEYAARKLEEVPDVLAEVYAPHYELLARPGGRNPDGEFMTGQDPGAAVTAGPAARVSLR